MALQLRHFESSKKLIESILEIVDTPESIRVVEITTGIMNEGKDNERPWANLTAVDTELYKKFESIRQEAHCPTFKVKLRNYHGEDLSTLQEREIAFDSYDIAYIFDKYKQPIGFALVLDLVDISAK